MEMASMTDVTAEDSARGDEREHGLDAVDEQLIDQLACRARAGGLQLAGEGGLLQQLTKRLLESALEGELTDHLGYDRHDPAGQNSGNSRNGHRAKTVLTDVGPVDIAPGPGGRLRAADREKASAAADGCRRDGAVPVGEGPHARGDFLAPG